LEDYDLDKIDFVIPWVDGDDKEWIKEKYKYKERNGDQNDIRFRDWGTLRYWFRGVEQYAPWVNCIHFITWGHIPSWLNTEHEKINIVRHDEYIPKQYLPTFSSHVIELNMHHIKGLADQFVYFNDDTFLVNKIQPEDFFKNGLPCDMAVLYPIPVGKDDMFSHILLNDSQFINRYFDLKKCIRQNKRKWISPVYGRSLMKTLCMLPFPEISGIMMHHQPQAYLKETFQQVWEKGGEFLDTICHNRFRCAEDVNQYIFRYWQMMNAKFTPSNRFTIGSYEEVGKEDKDYESIICNSRYKMLCLNDVGDDVIFDIQKENMRKAFQKKFPQKSFFEK